MHTTIEFLPDLLLVLVTAVCVVAIFRKLRLSPVLGYFVAGSIIGSYGFKIIDPKETEALAEFGIVFLLFAIGLELTFERLKSMRTHVFGFGSLQTLITAILIAFAIIMFDYSVTSAVVIGGALALSSTAIVLQVLAESRTQSTQVGRLSLATLLMQDFAVVPLLVLIPLLKNDKSAIFEAIGLAMLKALVALVGIFVLGRLLLRPLFGLIRTGTSAKHNELFVATTLLIALGTAWATDKFGLSLALGAFVAGLLVAETEFQHQAEESIAPFKGLFLGLFFMKVGMGINIELIMMQLPLVLVCSLMLITVKATVILLLSLLFKIRLGAAIHAGLLLSQGGEFAFILFGLAAEQGIIESQLSDILLLVVTFTMAITPLLSSLGGWIAGRLDKQDLAEEEIYQEIADLENHVIIAGFGRVGKMVSRMLEAEHVHYVAVDVNQSNVQEGREEGFPVYQGDISRLPLLQSVGIERAMSVIITVENQITLKKAAKTIQTYRPDVPIIARAHDLRTADDLSQAGVSTVVPETYETGLQLGGAALQAIGISEFEVARLKANFRAGGYTRAKTDDEEEKSEEEALFN